GVQTCALPILEMRAHRATDQAEWRRLREYDAICQVLWWHRMTEAPCVKAPDPLGFILNRFAIRDLDSLDAVADGTPTQFVCRLPKRARSSLLSHLLPE